MYVHVGYNESVEFYSFCVKMNNVLNHSKFTGQSIAERCDCLLSSKCECANIILYLHIPFLGSYVFVTAPEEGHRAILVSEFIQSSRPR